MDASADGAACVALLLAASSPRRITSSWQQGRRRQLHRDGRVAMSNITVKSLVRNTTSNVDVSAGERKIS
jgi:hypothetical protein